MHDGSKDAELSEDDVTRLRDASVHMNEVFKTQFRRVVYGEASMESQEVMIIAKALDSWRYVHEDDMKDTLAEWGQWMREMICTGQWEAFERLTFLVKRLGEGKPPSAATLKDLKMPRKTGRPNFTTTNLVLFAQAADRHVLGALIEKRKPDSVAIREDLDRLRSDLKFGNEAQAYRINATEFSRCVSHFKLNGLVSFKP